MPLRITTDPTTEVRPDYNSEEWATVRLEIIEAHVGPNPPTNEIIAAQLGATWDALQNKKIAQWNQQQLDDQEVENEQREDDERRRAELEKEAEERRKEQERKKPKLSHFDPQ